jgi:hypothetical protein
MNVVEVYGVAPGTSVSVSATASSVSGTIDCTGCDAVHVANTSATLYVSVQLGVGSATAVLGSDFTLPPMGWAVLGANAQITKVAAIGSAAGPTAVVFTPVKRGG